jgi:hypothetical protein
MIFIEVKALVGVNYVRAADIVAIQAQDSRRCVVIMQGGVSIPCAEPAAEVAARIEAALRPVQETEASPSPGEP